MKAIEFLGNIQNNQIQVPEKFSSAIKNLDNKKIRVIMLIEETQDYEKEQSFKSMAAEQFLNGYSEIDSVYDNY